MSLGQSGRSAAGWRDLRSLSIMAPLNAAALVVLVRVAVWKQIDPWLRLVAWATLAQQCVGIFYAPAGRYYYLTWLLTLLVTAVWLHREGLDLLHRRYPQLSAALQTTPRVARSHACWRGSRLTNTEDYSDAVSQPPDAMALSSPGRCRKDRTVATSLRLISDALQHRCPFPLFRLDVCYGFSRGHRARIAAAQCDLLLELGVADDIAQSWSTYGRWSWAYRAAPPEFATPLPKSRELFLARSADGKIRQRLLRSHGNRLDQAGLDRACDRGITFDDKAHASAHHIAGRMRRDRRYMGPCALPLSAFQDPCGEMRGLPIPVTAQEISLGRTFARAMRSESFATPRAAIDRHKHRILGCEPDGDKIARHADRQIGGRAWQRYEGGQDWHVQRVSIGRRIGGNPRSDAAAGVGTIDCNDLLGQIRPSRSAMSRSTTSGVLPAADSAIMVTGLLGYW